MPVIKKTKRTKSRDSLSRKRKPGVQKIKQGPAKAKPKVKKKPPVTNVGGATIPTEYFEGIIIAIDPGKSNLGYSVYKIDSMTRKKTVEPIEWGTIYGRGKGMQIHVGIIERIKKIVAGYPIDDIMLICEDYHFVPRKSNGMFVVPGLINIIKYIWYLMTKREVVIIRASDWKKVICSNGNADKAMVKDHIQKFISKKLFNDIITTYAEFRGGRKDNAGEQDCLDSISMGMYVALTILEQNSNQELTLEEPA